MSRITSLFGIRYPLIQAGMIWCSGWRLASAVSNAGGLGLIGAGSMSPEMLEEHIIKCKASTDKPFGVNLPLIYQGIQEQMDVVVRQGVKIVFTSAGNPAKFTSWLKERGIVVVHVVASVRSAVKCEQSGVDAIVAEGFEAGGHNGREETTTFTLVPDVCRSVQIPVIAAGGVATGRGMLAAFVLGAEGVQIGTRFAAAEESSAHKAFKEKILETKDGDTMLSLKKLIPVRLIRNAFYERVTAAENRGASEEELKEILGRGRAKLGMFDGDTEEGELEIGQVSALVESIQPAAEIVHEIMEEFETAKSEISHEP
jgi:enoyl-[acyl-carrier protein] reductase II